MLVGVPRRSVRTLVPDWSVSVATNVFPHENYTASCADPKREHPYILEGPVLMDSLHPVKSPRSI